MKKMETDNMTKEQQLASLNEQLKQGEEAYKTNYDRVYALWCGDRSGTKLDLDSDFALCAIQEKIDRIKSQIQELQ